MRKTDFRGLKPQVALLGLLFLAGTAVAAVLASQRGFFERFIKEKYETLPHNLSSFVEEADRGKIIQESFAKLSEAERMALYDNWMSAPNTLPEAAPSALVEVDAGLYISRAERTIVCGNSDQKIRAVKFLALSKCERAIPVLEKAHRWATRRSLLDLDAAISAAIDRIHAEN